ncbi:MAG: lysoplasmalogenase [Ruminococcaceae bacterium]|nr:lysoplasmalogenase [Oscillospiraceae bacterium]
MAYYFVLGLGCIMSLIFCINRAKGFSIKNLMLKSVSSLCYLLTAVFAVILNPETSVYGSLIIFGGALGLVGDILLDLKGIYRKDESAYLKGGFIFFLVGHLFYSAATIYTVRFEWWIVLLCVLAALIFGYLIIASAKIMKVHYGAYRTIVFIYTSVLSLSMFLAIAAAIYTRFYKGYTILAAGLILFTLSDAILSGTFFGRGKEKPFYFFTNHLTYYAGQYLIAASIMFM